MDLWSRSLDHEYGNDKMADCFWKEILGAVRRWRYNSELMALYEDLDLVSFIKLNRLRWIGHVYRMENTRKVTQVFYNNPQGSRQRGRPRHRWVDDVQTDLEKCGFRGWKQKVKDRDEWRRLMRETKARIGL